MKVFQLVTGYSMRLTAQERPIRRLAGDMSEDWHLRLLLHILWPIASYPRVDLDLVPELATKQLVYRNTQLSRYEALLLATKHIFAFNRNKSVTGATPPFRSQSAISIPARALMNTGPPR